MTGQQRTFIDLGLLVATAVLGWFLIAEYGARQRAEAALSTAVARADTAQREAVEAQAVAEAARAGAQATQAALAQATAQNRALSDSLARVLDDNVVVAHVAADDLDALITDIRAHLPEPHQHLADTALVRVRTLRDANDRSAALFARQAEEHEAYRLTATTSASAMRRDLDTVYQAAAAWERSAAAERERANIAERLATPGVLARIKGSLPFLSVEGTLAAALGFGIGVAVTR